MATPRTPANQRQRTWRPQSIQPEQLAKRRRVFRVVLPVMGVCLLAILLGVLYYLFTRPPALKLIAIAVADYRNPEAPPIPYCYEDIEALRKVVDPDASQNSALWNDANSDGIAQLETALRESASPRDNLLVYIKAHGVSLNEGAHLLGVDFELRGTGTTGRMPVEDLLSYVAESPAAMKLLVLDTGHLESDPRMGMLTNEFTHLLTKAVAEMPADSNVWVLTSNSLFERAHVSLKDRRSALSYYLTEGLRGAADGILADKDEKRVEDRLVQLDELYQYVRDHVMQYARLTSFDKQGQTPLLLQSGKGIATEIPNTFLSRAVPVEETTAPKVAGRSRPNRAADGSLAAVAGLTALALVANQAADATPAAAKDVPPQPTADKSLPPDAKAKEDPSASKGPPDDASKAAPAASKDDASKGTSDAKGPEKSAKAPDEAQKQPASAKEQPKSAPNDAAPKPPAKKRSAVEQSVLDYFSWLENEQNNSDFWRPVDYAPDLARVYYESVNGCAQRALAGHLFLNVPDYQASLQRKLSELRTLQGRIDDRRLSFRQGQARPSYDRDPAVRIAIRTRNDACHLLPLLVAHHWLLSANTPPTMQRDLAGLTAATLDLDRLLSQPADPQQADTIQAFENWKREVGTLETQVRDHIAKLKDDFQKRVVEQKRVAAAENNQAVSRSLAELAQSPFATAEVRDELQTLAESAARSFKEVEVGGAAALRRPPSSEQQRLSRAGWERAVDRARFELELLAFVLGAGNDARLAQHRKSLDSAMDQTTPDAQLQLARDLGDVLYESYRDVPVKVAKDLESIRYAAWRSAETAIRLADARDQSRVEKELTRQASRRWSDPIAGVPLEAVPKLERTYQLAVGDSPSSSTSPPIALDYETSRSIRLRFQSQNTSLPERVRLKLAYDDARVDVRGPQRTDLKPGAIWEFPTTATPGSTVTEHAIELALASHDQRGQQTNLTLTWLDENDSELDQASAVLIHPEPAFAQLAVFGQRETANHDWRENNQGEWFFDVPFPDGIGRVSLLTFSGHETRYDFRLTNGATHAKKYKSTVYAVPAPDDPFAERRSEATLIVAAEQGKRVLASSELSLAPGGTGSIPFFSAQPPAPNDPAASKAAPDTKKGAESAAKDPPPDVTSGMVCILEETTPVTQIDAPKPKRQVILIEVETLPPPRYVTPLVNYDAGRGEIAARLAVPPSVQLPLDGSRVEIEVITSQEIPQPPSAKRATTLTRQNPEDTLRAFVKRGTTDRAKVYLHVDGYPRAFIYELALDASLPNVERKSFELREITLPNPAAFRIYYPEKVDEPISFPFTVDMPPSAARMYLTRLFVDRQPGGDFVPREDALVFKSYEDRNREVVLQKPTDGPGMAVKSQVSDPKVMLDLSPYPGNQRVHVRAQIVRTESDGVEVVLPGADQELVLYLDGGAPAVIPEGPKGAVYENEPFSVAVQARDEVTGIKRIEYSPKVQKNPEQKAFDEMVLVEPKELRLTARSDPLVPLPVANVRVTHSFEKAGEQSLWFQATDESGNKSELAELPVTVRKIVPASGDTAAKAPGNAPNRLEGRVVFTPDGARGQIRKVVLTGPVNRQAKPSDDGSFVFDKLPPGEYEVKAEGIVNNSEGKSEPVKVTVEPAPKKMEPITVPLSR
jgi:hypothetical protein